MRHKDPILHIQSKRLQTKFFSFVLAFSTQLKRTKIFVFRSSFIRTNCQSDGQFLCCIQQGICPNLDNFFVVYNKEFVRQSSWTISLLYTTRNLSVRVATKNLSIRVATKNLSVRLVQIKHKSYEKASQMKKTFCFNNCACRVFRTNLVLV